jgi:hypothetical protein
MGGGAGFLAAGWGAIPGAVIGSAAAGAEQRNYCDGKFDITETIIDGVSGGVGAATALATGGTLAAPASSSTRAVAGWAIRESLRLMAPAAMQNSTRQSLEVLAEKKDEIDYFELSSNMAAGGAVGKLFPKVPLTPNRESLNKRPRLQKVDEKVPSEPFAQPSQAGGQIPERKVSVSPLLTQPLPQKITQVANYRHETQSGDVIYSGRHVRVWQKKDRILIVFTENTKDISYSNPQREIVDVLKRPNLSHDQVHLFRHQTSKAQTLMNRPLIESIGHKTSSSGEPIYFSQNLDEETQRWIRSLPGFYPRNSTISVPNLWGDGKTGTAKLFGSRAEGIPKRDSDYDVVISDEHLVNSLKRPFPIDIMDSLQKAKLPYDGMPKYLKLTGKWSDSVWKKLGGDEGVEMAKERILQQLRAEHPGANSDNLSLFLHTPSNVSKEGWGIRLLMSKEDFEGHFKAFAGRYGEDTAREKLMKVNALTIVPRNSPGAYERDLLTDLK